MMKQRIHMRIFLPVLLVMLLLPLAAWFAFSMTSDWYVRHMEERKVEQLMTAVEQEAAKLYGSLPSPETQDQEEAREISKQLLSQVKKIVKNEDTEARLSVFSSKMKQVYPGDGREGEDSGAISGLCQEMLEAGTFPSGELIELELNGKRYLARLYEVESDYNIRAKYLIGYVQIPETALLLSYTGRLIVFIVAVCLLVAGAAVWLVARSISKPLETLCGQTNRIGEGTYCPIEEEYSVQEVERLKQSFNRMAERLREAEAQNVRFFQNVSHDLRTPLVSITGYAQGIQCGVMKEPEKAAEIILTESLRMTNLVESILTISKMDNRELKLRRVKMNLEDFLEEQIEILQGISEEKELLLIGGDGSAEEAEKEAEVEADPELLIRIFQNVVSNSVRYAKSCVEVRLIIEDSGAVILVTDDGPGIADEDMPHLFERFYQGKNGKFGIGLSVVWSGMEYMGGKVSVYNRPEPEHGAVYRLWLSSSSQQK